MPRRILDLMAFQAQHAHVCTHLVLSSATGDLLARDQMPALVSYLLAHDGPQAWTSGASCSQLLALLGRGTFLKLLGPLEHHACTVLINMLDSITWEGSWRL